MEQGLIGKHFKA